MKRKMLFSALALLCFGGTALAGGPSTDGNYHALYQAAPGNPGQVAQVGWGAEVGCGCETPCDCDVMACEPTCEAGCYGEPGCGADVSCGCEVTCDGGCDGGCDSGCGCGGGLADLLGDCGLGDCDLGEPFALFGEVGNFSAGGWIQMGYFNKANSLFNSYADNYQLQQAWLYAEKAIDTSCGFDIGGRIDAMYGTDSQDTQAFGTDPRGWDNPWDNGGNYGWAMPQLYGEVGYGDLSFKIGHFYTIIGWEVVTAPDNFFYSHAYTMYNSEPFTHTGVLGTYNVNDDITAYGGYTFGWDSGFDDNGDNFLGGLSVALSDEVTLTYATTIGRFGSLPLGTPEQGYMHSIVADVAVTDSLQYIIQSDYLDTQAQSGGPLVRNTIGINQYLIYTLSDCWATGARFEWYNQEGVYSPVGQEDDIYALTLGVNYKPHANVICRPEIRWDWDDAGVAGLEDGTDQTTFAIDTIFLF